jgi:acyl-CoA reductase-like NAD-dependent aldehyde dehydrogenase
MSTHLDVLQNFIDGETVSSSGETEAILNPATGEELGRAPITSAEEVDGALAGAPGARILTGGARRGDRAP